MFKYTHPPAQNVLLCGYIILLILYSVAVVMQILCVIKKGFNSIFLTKL